MSLRQCLWISFHSWNVVNFRLQYLIQHNADVNIRDKDGLTPCMWACRLDHIKHFELLSSSPNFIVDEADGIERDLNGKTWMHWSVRRTEPLECLQVVFSLSSLVSWFSLFLLCFCDNDFPDKYIYIINKHHTTVANFRGCKNLTIFY